MNQRRSKHSTGTHFLEMMMCLQGALNWSIKEHPHVMASGGNKPTTFPYLIMNSLFSTESNCLSTGSRMNGENWDCKGLNVNRLGGLSVFTQPYTRGFNPTCEPRHLKQNEQFKLGLRS